MTMLLRSPLTRKKVAASVSRWKKQFDELYALAAARDDRQLIERCEDFFKAADRLIRTSSYPVAASCLTGQGMGREKVAGRVFRVRNEKELSQFIPGSILVAEDTTVVFIPLLRKARAIVTDRGGLTSHAATLAREFGIPAVIGTKMATKVLKTGDRVEVDTKKGIVKKLKK